MRQNGEVYFLLSDQLGSTSVAVNDTGTVVDNVYYKPWGEVRYSSGSLPTNYTFTGQMSDSYINLLDYGSRRYDPELGRFIQPDSIVPNPGNSQAYDRYSYTFNNPVKYTDPSGHAPCNIFGMCPDYAGISIATYYMSPHSRTGALITDEVHTYTAVGIAIQSQWADPIVRNKYSGEGPAQVSNAQMDTPYGHKVEGGDNGYGLGMPGQNQNNGYVASVAMRNRIEQVINVCGNTCTSTDKFIIAALAQNGPGFTQANMANILNPKNGFLNNDGTISWEAYFTSANKTSDDSLSLELRTGGLDYDTFFMLRLFYLDAKEMEAQGWYLPNDLDEERIKRLFSNTFQEHGR